MVYLYEVCSQIRSCMDYSQRLQLYHYLVSLGACDGLVERDVDLLETIANYIGLSKSSRKPTVGWLSNTIRTR